MAGIHAPFDRAMVLFHDIVQVWTRAASAATSQFPLLLQFRDHLRVRRIAVYIDYPWTGMTRRLQRFLEEAFGRGRITPGTQIEVADAGLRVVRARNPGKWESAAGKLWPASHWRVPARIEV